MRDYDAKRNQKEINPAVISNRKASDYIFEKLNLDSNDLQIKKSNLIKLKLKKFYA